VIVGGPVIEIYPAPLLPNLRLLRVTSDEIQKILTAADNAVSSVQTPATSAAG